MSERHSDLVETKEMDDDASEETQLQLADKATKITEIFFKQPDGKFVDIFNKEVIPDNENIKNYYEIIIRHTVQSGNKLPQLPDLRILKKEFIQRYTEYALQHVNTDAKTFENPFNLGEPLSYQGENFQHEISQKIYNMVTEMLIQKGINEEENVTSTYPGNMTYSGQMQLPVQFSHVSSTMGEPKNESNPEDKSQNQLDSDILDENKLSLSLKAGDATNPNTLLAYYYLKMRDYLRSMRRFVGFVRFYHGIEKEHTFITIRKDADSYTSEINHIYSKMHDKSKSEIENLKRFMNVDDIQSYKKIKTN